MGIDFFSVGANNPTSVSGQNSIWGNALQGPANAAQAGIVAGNQATANEQQIYANTSDNLNPYIQNGNDAMNMMRQMMGMDPLASNSKGAPNTAPGFNGTPSMDPGIWGGGSKPTAGSSKGRASGGPTYPGQTYVVGERGPEILHMSSGSHGYVEPNSPKADAAAAHSYPGRAMGGPVSGDGPATINKGGFAGMFGGDASPTMGSASTAGPAGVSNTPVTAANPHGFASNSNSKPLTGGMTPSQIMKMDPSYQFQLQQGESAVKAANLAGGSGLSGRETKGAIGYAEGLASQDYGNIFNREVTMAGMGESAAGTLGEVGMYTGMNEGNNYMFSGNAAAGGYMAPWNASVGMAGNVGSLLGKMYGGG